jgi:opacity protein-like surface antigen
MVLNLKMIKAGCVSFVLCVVAAAPASAQMTWTDKAFLNVNFGVQEGSHTLDTSSTFGLYGETGTLTTTQPIDGGALFDIGAGYRVWKNLAVGLGYSRVQSDGDVTLEANIPDPNFFDRARGVTGVASNAEHAEHAIHLQGTWVMPVTDKMDVAFSFGPTIFMVSQDIATGISVAEPTPTISSTTITRQDKTTVGINLGADVNYFFRPRIGAGLLVRYTTGSVDLAPEDGSLAVDSLSVGGFQVGVGLRVRF